MEKLVKIVDQMAHVTRSYTDKNGQSKVFDSMGFILCDGISYFYAEMIGDMARNAPAYDKDMMHTMQGYCKVRDWEDKDGKKHYENSIVITKMI